ncbi:hypothetical protein [Nitrosopumilus ureiphilus]|uniref:Phage protein n=1 Tax=Nitrosopumilus ureiphilus TaxID=1470067 RepID=A0A7D5R7C2_9ARCH|nr:hypothetical protein [Nitrosopumilus ureiphilus]QLH06679.1 hypothetical protein C5F50_06010 [Nitrosopumilus ureiphilus]
MGTIEDKKEIETLLNIVINQIPSYTNMVNSEHWDMNLDDCIFGMVYHSFVAKATNYLNNKLTDTEQETNAESTFQMMNLISEVFNDRLADIKQEIVSALNS